MSRTLYILIKYYHFIENIVIKYCIQGVFKTRLQFSLYEKCLKNSKILVDGVFHYIYSHLLNKLQILGHLEKKLRGLTIF